MMHNGNNNNVSMAMAGNRVEEIYDVIFGTGCVIFSILVLANLFIVTIEKFVNYYSRQIDRIVMDESFDDDSCDSDDDDSSESDYSEYSESESSECSESRQYDDIKLSPYVPPRRSERLAESRARCNSPLLICRLKFD
jgi:hypothetical protein